MSHFAAVYQANSIEAQRRFAAYEARLLATRVAGSSTAAPSTTTVGTFVVPAQFSTVMINVTSASPGGAPFLVGDTVSVGELYGYYTTPAAPSPLTNPITFTLAMLGSWRANYAPGGLFGLYVKGPNGESTTTTSSITVPSFTSRNTSVSVANPAAVPNSSRVRITSYAGVYEVTGVNTVGNTLTLRLIHPGDLVPGDTVIAGAYVSQGALLGVMPPSDSLRMFYPVNVLSQVLRITAGGSSNSPVFSLGWGANADSGSAISAYGQFCDGNSAGGGLIAVGTSAVVDRYKFHVINGNNISNDAFRRGVPPNMPLFARMQSASTATAYEVLIAVRGFFV